MRARRPAIRNHGLPLFPMPAPALRRAEYRVSVGVAAFLVISTGRENKIKKVEKPKR